MDAAQDETRSVPSPVEMLVHQWRAEQIERLGITRLVAEAAAELVDWHELARLVHRGCTPALALEIVR
jgi:hypothetical protein